MKSILKADFYRILKDKIFIILCILCAGLSVLISALFGFVFKMADMTAIPSLGSAFGIAELLSSPAGTFGIILTIFTAILIGKDNSTVRNKIICGKSRRDIFFANFIVILTVYLGFSIIHLLLSFLIGLIFLPAAYFTLEPYQILICIIYKLIGYVAMGSFFSFFLAGLRNVALAIVLTIAGSYLLELLGLIVPFASLAGDNPALLEFLNAIKYINIPTVLSSTFDANLFEVGPAMAYLITCGLLIGCGLSLGCIIFNKKDLK